jgi:DDE superfamily endonuclease
MAGPFGAGGDLDRWLAPFLDALGHKRRRTWARLYLRGLLGPGERKSLLPMAACLGLSGHDQLHHLVASPAWDDSPLWCALAERADRLVGGPDPVLAIDDTALPKKGELSAGVARQYCGQLGKKANCQALVSLTLARDDVPVPIALRLFLPEEWTRDPARCARAGVPEAEVVARSKGEIARWPNSTGCGRRACGSASCWPMRATARAPSSGMGWTGGGCAGRWASRAIRRSTAPTCASSRRPAAGLAAACRTRNRVLPGRSWPSCPGGG